MNIGVISVRYARALLQCSLDAQLEDKVYSEMQTLAQSYACVPELKFTLDNPTLPKQSKEKLLIAAAGNDVTTLTKSFVSLVLKEDRESVMQFMANSFITLYRKQKNIIRAKLTTAAAVSSSVEDKMKQMVASKTNGIVEFETEVDADIIGGFILEYDTYRMDASVKSKLNTILSQLSK